MKVITLLNEKGGVGKTTLTGTIGAGLAIMGYRVLLIDADPQGHLTLSFGMQKAHSLYDLLVRDAEFNTPGIVQSISPEVYAFPNGNLPKTGRLFLISGNRETRLIAQAIEADQYTVRRRLNELATNNIVDFVIFDTSPTPSNFHAHVYLATDHIIFPTEVAALSFDGLRESIGNTTRLNKRRERDQLDQIKITGIVPTKFRARTAEHRENFKQLQSTFGSLVWNPLPMSVVWEEAMARQRTVFNYAYDHPVVADAWKIVRKVKEQTTNGTQA